VQNPLFNLNPRANTPASSIGKFGSCVSSSTKLNKVTQNVFIESFDSFLIYLLIFSTSFPAEVSNCLPAAYQLHRVIGFTMVRMILFAAYDAFKAVLLSLEPGSHPESELLIRLCDVALSGDQGVLLCERKLHSMCYTLYDLRSSSISSRFILSAKPNHTDWRKSANFVEA
jgi:hypothetical protein